MSIEQEYAELFSDTVTVRGRSSTDAYGKPTFGAATTVTAHVVWDQKVFPVAEGRNVTQDGIAYLWGTPTVDTRSGMTLSDGTSVIVLDVAVRWDENGPHHTVVRFGRA